MATKNWIAGIFVWTWALLIGTPVAHGQCSSVANMESIAAQNDGWVIYQVLDDESEFAIWIDTASVVYVFAYGGWSSPYLTLGEDENGAVTVSIGDAECQVRCADAEQGGVTVALTTENDDTYTFDVSATGDVLSTGAGDACPCRGTGWRFRATCTQRACNERLACKKQTKDDPNSKDTGWCDP
jgi:hypothetical protein